MCIWNPDSKNPLRQCTHGHAQHEELPTLNASAPPYIWCNKCYTVCAFNSSYGVKKGFRAWLSDHLLCISDNSDPEFEQVLPRPSIYSSKSSTVGVNYQSFQDFNRLRAGQLGPSEKSLLYASQTQGESRYPLPSPFSPSSPSTPQTPLYNQYSNFSKLGPARSEPNPHPYDSYREPNPGIGRYQTFQGTSDPGPGRRAPNQYPFPEQSNNKPLSSHSDSGNNYNKGSWNRF